MQLKEKDVKYLKMLQAKDDKQKICPVKTTFSERDFEAGWEAAKEYFSKPTPPSSVIKNEWEQ